MMHMQGSDGCYLGEDGQITPYNDEYANASCFQYDPESQANASDDLADSFVSSRRMQAKRARQREIRVI